MSRHHDFSLLKFVIELLIVLLIFDVVCVVVNKVYISNKYPTSKIERQKLNNSEKFDPDFVKDEVYNSTYLEENAMAKVASFYQTTGIQYYEIVYSIKNISWIETDEDAISYIKDRIVREFPNHEYSVILFSTDTKYFEDNYNSVSIYDEWYFGDKVTEFFDADGFGIFYNTVDAVTDGYKSELLPTALEYIGYQVMGKNVPVSLPVSTIISWDIFIIIFIAVIVVMKSVIKPKQNDIDAAILDTPMEDLIQMYSNDDDGVLDKNDFK